MHSRYLSETERIKGRKNMLMFEFFNGVSYGLLGDTLVYVLAARFFSPNYVLSFIPTIIYVSALIIPLGVRFFNKKNFVKTMYQMWLLRGFVGIGYLGLLFLKGEMRTTLLVIIYFLYAIFRALGIISYDPIVKSVTTLHNRGSFYATLNFAYNFTLLFVALLASIITTFYNSLLLIVSLQMVGVLGNTIASFFARRIPCKMTFSYDRGEVNYIDIFKNIIRSEDFRYRTFSRWTYYLVKIFIGMSVPFMSRRLHLSDALVILYSVIISVAYLSAGLISRALSDKVGAKPLMQLSSSIAIISALSFVICPEAIPFWLFMIFGYFCYTSVQVCDLQASSLVVGILPDENAASYSVVINIVSGIVSIIAGILSGFLLDAGETFTLVSKTYIFNAYSLCFSAGLFFSVLGAFFIHKLRKNGAKNAMQLVSFKNLQAIFQLNAAEKSADSFLRRRHIMYLGEYSSNFIYTEIHQKLLSPYSRDLADLLRVLGEKRRSEYIKDIVRIASNDNNYVQTVAIDTLSNFTSSQVAKDCLINVFYHSQWISARTAAAKSLSKFTEVDSYYKDVEVIERDAKHIDVCVDCLIAEYNMDSEKRLFMRIFEKESLLRTKEFKQTRYSCYDALLLNENALSRLARMYEIFNNTSLVRPAIETFLEENRSIDTIADNFSNILTSVENSDVYSLFRYSSQMIENIESERAEIKMCKMGILEFFNLSENEAVNVSQTDLIALLYFSVLLNNQTQG